MELHDTDIIDTTPLPFRVGVVPTPGFPLMSYACTVEPLRAANLLSGKPLYDVVHFSADGVCHSSGDALVDRTLQIPQMPPLDLLFVVAGGDPLAFDDPEIFDWLSQMAKRVPQLGGVSGGSVILAKAGLMRERRMTVHWEHAEALHEWNPDLMIERRLYVIDRDRVTCGGGTAPLDLLHALISAHHGATFARLVSDWFLHTDVRAAAAPQRGLPSARTGVAPKHVIDALTAMETHVADPLTLSHLALTTGISARQLNRLFRQTFGQSAMTYYRHLRLEVARRMVTGTAMSFADIAEATGFASAAHFSNQYAQVFNCRPRRDRQGAPALEESWKTEG